MPAESSSYCRIPSDFPGLMVGLRGNDPGICILGSFFRSVVVDVLEVLQEVLLLREVG